MVGNPNNSLQCSPLALSVPNKNNPPPKKKHKELMSTESQFEQDHFISKLSI